MKKHLARHLTAAFVLTVMVGEAVAGPGGNPFETIKDKLDRIEEKIDWLLPPEVTCGDFTPQACSADLCRTTDGALGRCGVVTIAGDPLPSSIVTIDFDDLTAGDTNPEFSDFAGSGIDVTTFLSTVVSGTTYAGDNDLSVDGILNLSFSEPLDLVSLDLGGDTDPLPVAITVTHGGGITVYDYAADGLFNGNPNDFETVTLPFSDITNVQILETNSATVLIDNVSFASQLECTCLPDE